MRRLANLVLGLAAVAASAAQNPPAREGSYWVSVESGTLPGGCEQLRFSGRGTLTFLGRDGGSVAYTIKRRVRAATQQQAQSLAQSIRLQTAVRGATCQFNLSLAGSGAFYAELQVEVPARVRHVAVQSEGGAVEARALSGSLFVETGGGPIRVRDLRGSLTARTAGGEITLDAVRGMVHCSSGGGDIRAGTIGGEARLETAGGEIHVEEAQGAVHAATGGGNIDIRSAATTVNARTAGGLVRVQRAGGQVLASTGGGTIQVASARDVRVESAAGGIRLQNVSGALRASTGMGSILAELPSGSLLRNSYFNTAGGDITVYIPSNLAVRVEAMNQSAQRLGRIISEFPEIRIRTGQAQRLGPTIAEGVLNGGGPLLKLAAVEGTIYLRRSK